MTELMQIEDPIAALSQMGLRMNFLRDEEIYGQGEDADLIYVVLRGAIRTTRLFSDGRRQIGDFYYPGDVFGLEPGEVRRFSAEAQTDCIVAAVRRKVLAADAPFAGRVLAEATSRELARTQEHLLVIGRKTACEKVASFLNEFVRHAPEDMIELPMGRQDIADYLGLTIETVSRMVTQLQAAGIVEFSGCRQFNIRNASAFQRLSE